MTRPSEADMQAGMPGQVRGLLPPLGPLLQCWLWANGWATVDDAGTLAGYMDGGREQAAECRTLRGGEPCPAHPKETAR